MKVKTIKAFFKNMIDFKKNERMKAKIEILMEVINKVNFERAQLKEEIEKLKLKIK